MGSLIGIKYVEITTSNIHDYDIVVWSDSSRTVIRILRS